MDAGSGDGAEVDEGELKQLAALGLPTRFGSSEVRTEIATRTCQEHVCAVASGGSVKS